VRLVQARLEVLAMSNSLQGFDLLPEVDLDANEKARRVVAGYPTTDVEATREILSALGLLPSTPVEKPVDKRRAS
jgi:hypothetical protein